MKLDLNRKYIRTKIDENDFGWFSISHRLVENKYRRRPLYGNWFCKKANGKTIYRQLKFNPTLKSNDGQEQIALDWLGSIKLNNFNSENETSPIKYEIHQANRLESIYANIYHPDQGLRAAYKLGIVSLILGLISLVISLIYI